MAETWVINESPNIPDSNIYTNINFISNNENFTNFGIVNNQWKISLLYDNVQKLNNTAWVNQAYRTVIFETAPTGNLLTWLQTNGTLTPSSSPSTADKLQDLIDIKQDIKEAIENKDVDLTGVDFGGYAGKIDEIPLPKKEETKTITPDFSSGNIVVTPTTDKVMTQVTINKDINLIADNIRSGVTIFGITGDYPKGYTLTFNDISSSGYWAKLNITYANGTTVNISEGIYSSVVSINSIDGYYSYSGFTVYYPSTNSYNYSASLPYTLTENITLSASYGSGVPCLVKGTQITLADKSIKLIENIEYEDDLLVWDFDEGQFNTSKPIWIQKQKEAHEYNHLVFSDGSELDTVSQHRIFNVEKGKFTYPMTDDTPIGTTTFNSKGEFVTLVSKGIIKKKVEYYNIITNYHMNAFTGTILTSCRLSNLYPIVDMQYVKDNRELHNPEIFNELDDKWVSGLRLLEQPLEINRDNAVVYENSLVDYVKRMERDKI